MCTLFHPQTRKFLTRNMSYIRLLRVALRVNRHEQSFVPEGWSTNLRLNEALTQFVGHVVLHGVGDFVQAQRLHHQHLLESVQLFIPLARQRLPASVNRCTHTCRLNIHSHARAHSHTARPRTHTHTHTYTLSHTCTHTFTFSHTNIHTNTVTHTHKHTHKHTLTYTHTHTNIYTHKHTHSHTYTNTRTRARARVRAHTHIQKHTRAHTHTHTPHTHHTRPHVCAHRLQNETSSKRSMPQSRIGLLLQCLRRNSMP